MQISGAGSELFNYHAEKEGLRWRAFSRGAAERGSPNNVGPISRFAFEGLEAIGIMPKRADQFPQPCCSADFDRAQLVIALKEAEHRSMVERRFPEMTSQIIYWHVDDMDVADPKEVLPVLEQLIANLIVDLQRSNDRPRNLKRSSDD